MPPKHRLSFPEQQSSQKRHRGFEDDFNSDLLPVGNHPLPFGHYPQGFTVATGFPFYSNNHQSLGHEVPAMSRQLETLTPTHVPNHPAPLEAGIDPGRIVLGGFSMGGAMTLLTGLSIKEQLGGLVVLSGWLPLRNKLKSMLSSHAKDVPIFWGHGADDPLVQLRWGKLSKDVLTSSEIGIPEALSPSEGKGLSFNVYPGLQHSASDRELDDAKTWLKKVLPGN
ncbi:hypothetical protein HGRIS_014803 [Hohenbuehelia grisea]|uniref:Acyl-protein thioesterase 1 n=1 Tax=Hohenbuehelia grisea TaxID=104357 RepID=A0ABR3IQT2_9AGAR